MPRSQATSPDYRCRVLPLHSLQPAILYPSFLKLTVACAGFSSVGRMMPSRYVNIANIRYSVPSAQSFLQSRPRKTRLNDVVYQSWKIRGKYRFVHPRSSLPRGIVMFPTRRTLPGSHYCSAGLLSGFRNKYFQAIKCCQVVLFPPALEENHDSAL